MAGYPACLPCLSFDDLPFDPDDEALRCLVEALAKSGQALSLYDADDNLRYANEPGHLPAWVCGPLHVHRNPAARGQERHWREDLGKL